jgi:Right handed beta helix region
MQSRNFGFSKEVWIGLVLAAFLAVPVFVFGGSGVIFVDKDASGAENGTATHPYHTISEALKNAEEGTEVHIKNGTYKENITIPKGVDVVGDSGKREKVTIESDNNDKPTVTMKNNTAIKHITVKGGRHGVRVLEDARVHILDAVIKKSDRDGVHIDSAPRDNKHRVLIDETTISDNDRAGIFSEKRYIILLDSEIISNGSDGLDLAAGTKAWLEDNRFNDNKGSGAKFVLDDASIFGKKNGFRNNRREGLEVNAFGASGTIELKRSAFVKNNRYGVARIARTAAGMRMFGNLSFGIGINDSRFDNNILGSISPVIRGF